MSLLTGLADELGVTLVVASHAQDLMRRLGLQLVPHRTEETVDDSVAVTVSA